MISPPNSDSRPTWPQYFMQIAHVAKTRSTCVRRKVGCVLTDAENRIVGMGYNGVPRSMRHCSDVNCAGANLKSGEGLDLCMAVHAEQNALMHCTDILKIQSCYTTTLPCVHCIKLLLNTSCEKIYFSETYSSFELVSDLWCKKGGRELCRLEE